MIISGISFNPYIGHLRQKNNFNFGFGNIKPLEKDTFEPSYNTKEVTIKDLSGRKVNASIVSVEKNSQSRDIDGILKREKNYEMLVDGEEVGYMKVSNRKDSLYVNTLFTKEHNYRRYKGAGTELLKCAVNESIKRGYEGKITLEAFNASLSPMVFYYKNNFTVPKSSKNIVLQYAMQNNIPVENLLLDYQCIDVMSLNKTGAKALLRGKRLADDRNIEKVASSVIDDKTYNAYFMKSDNKNEYYLLVLRQNPLNERGQLSLTLNEEKGTDNKKHFVISDVITYAMEDEIPANFAVETVKELARQKNYDDNVIISGKMLKSKRDIFSKI